MSFIKRAASRVFRSMPLWFWERVVPKDVIALCYHIVSDEDLPHQVYYSYKNARQFENDVVYAKRRAVGYDEVARHRLGSQPLPRSRILFTFDDGFAECFHVVRPILRKHSVPGVFFVTTSFLDDQRLALSERGSTDGPRACRGPGRGPFARSPARSGEAGQRPNPSVAETADGATPAAGNPRPARGGTVAPGIRRRRRRSERRARPHPSRRRPADLALGWFRR